MSILGNLLKMNLGAFYDVDDGIQIIKQETGRSRKLILNNIPRVLLEKVLPLLKNKKISISLSENGYRQSIEEDIEDIYYHTANIQVSYGDQKMNYGCIVLPNIIFDIIWDEEEGIQSISGVKDNDCLKCDFRLNLCEYAEECGGDIYIGKILNVEEGVRQLLKDFKKSQKVIIVYVPDFFIEKIIPFFEGKDIRILLPYGHRVHPAVKKKSQIRIARNWITPNWEIRDHGDAIAGGICFPHIHYGVVWKDSKIFEIRTIEVDQCVRCMLERHIITAWTTGKRFNC